MKGVMSIPKAAPRTVAAQRQAVIKGRCMLCRELVGRQELQSLKKIAPVIYKEGEKVEGENDEKFMKRRVQVFLYSCRLLAYRGHE
jgi:hypothetical protein